MQVMEKYKMKICIFKKILAVQTPPKANGQMWFDSGNSN